MERKHQIFVSSTYKDLTEERKEVIHALLELDCIPAGMELFPATDEDAWSLIKEIIEDCDYYILILAGKYGSTNKDGVGYTEMEYDYAVKIGKPVISFLYENIENLTASKFEKTEATQEKLKIFRIKVEAKHCKYWSTPHDLGGKVSRSLIQLRKKHPSDGWVPGRYAADAKMLREFEEMRARLAELDLEELVSKDSPPPGAENYKQGKETYSRSLELKVNNKGKKKKIYLSPSWDKLFSYCGSTLANECDDEALEERLQLAYWHSIPGSFEKFNDYDDVIIPYVMIDRIKIQFQALGLMAPGTKKRAVSDTKTYWKITPYGVKYLIQISAIRRDQE